MKGQSFFAPAAIAALLVAAAGPAAADSNGDVLVRAGTPGRTGLVQALTGLVEKDKLVSYADYGWKRKVENGAYLKLGKSFHDESRAGMYLAWEEDNLRLMFKMDLGN